MSNRGPASFRLNRTGCAVLVIIALILASLCVGWAMLSFGPAIGLFVSPAGARFRIEGFSMAPTLQDGSFVLADQQALSQRAPRRGDIILYKRPSAPERLGVARIVGLPRERVQVKVGRVIVNGATLVEPYVGSPAEYEGEWILKDGEYFVLGDNRNGAFDSHAWGPLPAGNMLGKAEWVYWPPSVWGSIPAVSYAQ